MDQWAKHLDTVFVRENIRLKKNIFPAMCVQKNSTTDV